MTDAQLQAIANALRADVTATPNAAITAYADNPTLTLTQAMAVRNDVALTAWENSASTFVVWKTGVSINAIGDKINGTELAGLSSLNTTRLQAVIMLSPSGVNPSLTDRRQFFDDIFSGAGGTNTRAALLALWKRFATRCEKVFVSGTGSDAVPGLIGSFEGSVSINDVSTALNRF